MKSRSMTCAAETCNSILTPVEISGLRRRLLAWYERDRRPLPWRATRDPYRIWVSEAMLQQTQVDTVIPYYRRFIRRLPNVQELARADLEDVLKLWEGLGYYARARNLHRAAGMLVERRAGRIPDRWEDFRALPGVGDYIAAAVLSIAFEQPYAVVDGNVKRVLARLLTMSAPVNQAASHKIFQAEADRLLDRRRPGDFNQSVMELGALICTPSSPNCTICPLTRFCAAHRGGTFAQYPRRVASRPVPEVQIAVGVVFKNGRVLITRRPSQGLLGGLWEFPGGKLRENESPAAACVREIKEEVNLDVIAEKPLALIRHAYSHFRIHMHVFRCRFTAGRVHLRGPVDHRWVRMTEIGRFPFPKANHKFIPLLKGSYKGNQD
jgi:A/G-specific adenine glycosylase